MKNSGLSKLYIVYLFMLLAALFGYGMTRVCSFLIFPDEFGYWAVAARLIGRDWSEVASIGSYYSFGYGLLLWPLLALSRDGVMVYRLACGMNLLGMFIAFGMLLSWCNKISGRELSRMKDKADDGIAIENVLICAIALMYPSWFIYAQTTLTEALLTFLFVLIVYLMQRFLKEGSAALAFLLLFLLTYAYFVHMRMLGVLLSGCLCICIRLVGDITKAQDEKQKKRRICILAAAAVLTVALILLGSCIKSFMMNEVFGKGATDTLNRNDYLGVISKLKRLFSIRGAAHFVGNLTGRLFYIICAGFTLPWWGIRRCYRKIKSEFDKFYVFMLLSIASEVLISALFMVSDSRTDSLIHGRYIDFLMPVFMVLGLLELKEMTDVFKRFLLLLGGCAPVTAVTVIIAICLDLEKPRGYMMLGISHLYFEKSYEPCFYFWVTYLASMAVSLIIISIVKGMKNRRNGWWTLTFLIIFEAGLIFYGSTHYVYKYNESNFKDRIIAETITKNMYEDSRIVVLKENKALFFDLIQMYMPTEKIEVKTPEECMENIEDFDFAVVFTKSESAKELEKRFDNCITSNTFRLYYN